MSMAKQNLQQEIFKINKQEVFLYNKCCPESRSETYVSILIFACPFVVVSKQRLAPNTSNGNTTIFKTSVELSMNEVIERE